LHSLCRITGKRHAHRALGIPVATVRASERDETPVDPVLQALLRILDRMPKSALRALEATARKAE
jgi:hypothetical protein